MVIISTLGNSNLFNEIPRCLPGSHATIPNFSDSITEKGWISAENVADLVHRCTRFDVFVVPCKQLSCRLWLLFSQVFLEVSSQSVVFCGHWVIVLKGLSSTHAFQRACRALCVAFLDEVLCRMFQYRDGVLQDHQSVFDHKAKSQHRFALMSMAPVQQL